MRVRIQMDVPIIWRDVAVVFTQKGAVCFWSHHLLLFQCHDIFVHLFEDVWITTHYEQSHPDDFVRMSSGLKITPSKVIRMTYCTGIGSIGKTPAMIILWCPTTEMFIKACFIIQPLEQEGGCQKCCIYLCSKVFLNHFYQMKASPECSNILIYGSKY